MFQQDFRRRKPIYKVETDRSWLPAVKHSSVVIGLIPLIDVARHSSGVNTWVAKSDQPWLQVIVDLASISKNSVEIVYESSLLDVLTRPIIRFVFKDRIEDLVLPAPIGGRGVWIGRVPEGVTQILISPVDAPGTFGFRVLECRPIGKWRKTQRALRYHPFSASWAVALWLVGYRDKARRRVQRALGAVPLSAHHFWLSSRTRSPEWDGLDAPRTVVTPHLRIILLDASEQQEAKLVGVLGRQPRSEWSTMRASSERQIISLIGDLKPQDFFMILHAGDEIAPEAPAILAETFARNPADLYYADERDLGQGLPRFKPDWSPVLSQSVDILGGACFYRVDWVRERLGERVIGALRPEPLSPDDKIVHIRRLLVSCGAPPQKRATIAMPKLNTPACSIIIPIRDHHKLLRQCLDSILCSDIGSNVEIVIVDNDSIKAETASYLSDISQDERIRILRAPGPFNFSALCNTGAREAKFDMLVFLNNDTRVLSSDWLQKLTSWARYPDIGAVGAKLLFPNARVQHAGVALGMHGAAAHFEAGASQHSAGYFGRLGVPHELSAVTGACLAIERSKFDLVGGFDEVNLPVEFSDIDLCLKLQEQGLRNLIEPRARLIHLESASRGNTVPAELRYQDEIAYFRQRWLSIIRNDPYLHPALSIETTKAALG